MAHRNLRIAELRPKHNPTKKELPAHDARAFYRAAVDAHSLGRGVPDDDAFFASVSRKGPGLAAASKSSTWNPPEPPAPGCRPDGVVPQEAQAEFIHCLFAYMHNLHHQKVSAYEKLEAALKRQNDLEAEIQLLRGLVGVPHYLQESDKRVELEVSHYPCLELHWVVTCLKSLPTSLAGGCYLLWRPSPSIYIRAQKGFIPLCISIVEPTIDPETRQFSRCGDKLSHRYIFFVDGTAAGPWGDSRGTVAVSDEPWNSDPKLAMASGECFESLDSFIKQSPDLIKEITTYRFPAAATKPHVFEFLEEKLAASRLWNDEERPRVREVCIEDVKPRLVHHHHQTTEKPDGSLVFKSQGVGSVVDPSENVASSATSQGWAKIQGMTRGAMAIRNALLPDTGTGTIPDVHPAEPRSGVLRSVRIRRRKRANADSDVSGIGMGFERSPDGIHTVCDLFSGGAARQSGVVFVGDRILSVDGVAISGMSVLVYALRVCHLVCLNVCVVFVPLSYARTHACA